MATTTLPILVPTGLESTSGTAWTNTTYGNIDNGVATPDGAFIVSGTNPTGGIYFQLSDMPSDFGKMATLTFNIRYKLEGNINDTEALYISIYESTNGALVTEVLVDSLAVSKTITNKGNTSFTINSTGLSLSNYYWNRALIYIRTAHTANMGADASVWSIDEIEINGTYYAIPALTTSSCTTITKTTAVGNGNITSLGSGSSASRRGFCYMLGTTGDPTIANSVVYDDGTFSTGAYTKSITGLTHTTNYRVRAYCVNSDGLIGYGSTIQLTTEAAATPTVLSTSITQITRFSVLGTGEVTIINATSITRRGFCYMAGSGTPTIANSVVYDDGTFSTGVFTKSITGLTKGTNYSFRAFAINSDTGVGYGSVINTTTENEAIPYPVLISPSDLATNVDTLPTLLFKGTDANNDTLEFVVDIDTSPTFDSGGITLTSIAIFCLRSLGPTGSLYIEIRKIEPSGELIATSNYLTDLITWDNAQPTLKTFTFSPFIYLSNLYRYYAIVKTTASYDASSNVIAIGAMTTDNGNSLYFRWYTNGWRFPSNLTFNIRSYGYRRDGTYGHFLDGSISSNIMIQGETNLPADTPSHHAFGLVLDNEPLICAFSELGEPGFQSGHPFTQDTQTSYTLQNPLIEGVTYYWRIRVKDPSGSASYSNVSYSEVRSFTVKQLAVTLNSPNDTATGVSTTPTLLFTGVGPVSSLLEYQFQLDTVSDFKLDIGLPIDGTSYESNLVTTYTIINLSNPARHKGLINTVEAFVYSTFTITYAKVGTFYRVGNSMILRDFAVIGPIGRNAKRIFTGFSLATEAGDYLGIYMQGTNSGSIKSSNIVGSGFAYVNIDGFSGNPTWNFMDAGSIALYGYGTIDYKDSAVDTTFVDVTDGSDTHPFDSGDQIQYAISPALPQPTLHYWRARAKVTNGTNQWGTWATARSFTTGTGQSAGAIAGAINDNISSLAGILQAKGKLIGASDNISSLAGIFKGKATFSGALAITISPVGNIRAKSKLVGSSDNVSILGGILKGRSTATGTLTLTLATTVVSSVKGKLRGSSENISSLGTALKGRAPVTGAVSVVVSTSANALGRGKMIGTTNNVSTLQGVMKLKVKLSGTGVVILQTVSNSTGRGRLIGQTAGVSDLTAPLKYKAKISGALPIIISTSANAVGRGKLVANSAGISVLGGIFKGKSTLRGSIFFDVQTVANSIGIGKLRGTCTNSTSLTGAIKMNLFLSGANSVVLSTTGAVKGKGKLLGVISTSTDVAVNPTGVLRLTGALSVAVIPTGAVTGKGKLTGATAGVSTLSAVVKGRARFTGTLNVTLSSTGASAGKGKMHASAENVSSLSGIFKGKTNILGAIAISIASVGAMSGKGKMVAVCSTISTISAAAKLYRFLSGGSSILVSTVGNATGKGKLRGAVDCTSTLSAVRKAIRLSTGTLSLSLAVTSVSKLRAKVSGTVPVTISVTASAYGRGKTVGQILAESSVSGTLLAKGRLSGIITPATDCLAKIGGKGALIGFSDCGTSAVAITGGVNPITGTVSIGVTSAGALKSRSRVAGTGAVLIQTVSTSRLKKKILGLGAISVSATVTSNLKGALRGIISGGSENTAELKNASTPPSTIAGTTDCNTQLSGELQGRSLLSGNITVAIQNSGALRGIGKLIGQVDSGSICIGWTASGGWMIATADNSATASGTLLGYGEAVGQSDSVSESTSKIGGFSTLGGVAGVSVSLTGRGETFTFISGGSEISFELIGDLYSEFNPNAVWIAGSVALELLATGLLSQNMTIERAWDNVTITRSAVGIRTLTRGQSGDVAITRKKSGNATLTRGNSGSAKITRFINNETTLL